MANIKAPHYYTRPSIAQQDKINHILKEHSRFLYKSDTVTSTVKGLLEGRVLLSYFVNGHIRREIIIKPDGIWTDL